MQVRTLTSELASIHVNHNTKLPQQIRPEHSNTFFARWQNRNHANRVPIHQLFRAVLVPRQLDIIAADVQDQVRQLLSGSASDRGTVEETVGRGTDGFVYHFCGAGRQSDGWLEIQAAVDGGQRQVQLDVSVE